MDAFNDELNGFKDRIRARAQARIDAAMKEYEEVRVPSVLSFHWFHYKMEML